MIERVTKARPDLRQLLLGLLGYPGDGDVPRRGWLRWAMIGTYGLIAIVVALIVVALVFADQGASLRASGLAVAFTFWVPLPGSGCESA